MYTINNKGPEATDEIKAKRKEILEWERDNRTSKNRVTNSLGSPRWIDPVTGQCCAIARLIPRELAETFQSLIGAHLNEPLLNRCPQDVKALGGEFLGHLQLLHDNSENWDEDGLSEIGRNTWNAIAEAYT